MHTFHTGPLRNVSNQKNFRSMPNNESCHTQQNNMVDDLRQRQKVYLDVIVDLTNRNRQLQQQNRMYAQHCEMLEEELRRRIDSATHNRNTRSTSSEKNLFRGFGKVQPEFERPQIDVLRKEFEQVDESPELMNNSSRFVERMALILDTNFGDEPNNHQKADLPENPSCIKSDSFKSQQSTRDCRTDSFKMIQGETPIDFSSKNTQIRNIYTVARDNKEQSTLSAFSKTSYKPMQLTPSFPSTSTSRIVKQPMDPTNRQSNPNNFHRMYTEDRQNTSGTRQNIHSLFVQQQHSNINIKPTFTNTLRSNSNNSSLNRKEYLNIPSDGSHDLTSNTYNTSSQSSLATYQNSNTNSQLRIGTHY